MIPFDPPIKIQGKKTRIIPAMAQAGLSEAAQWVDAQDGIWIEPFTGSGAVGFNFAVGKMAVFADANPHLIALYKGINSGAITPQMVRDKLEYEGAQLFSRGADHYYAIRDRFNETADPLDFLFLSRSSYNGLIRFNKSGGFNSPFCKNPSKFSQSLIDKIVGQVYDLVARCLISNWFFVCSDFRSALNQMKSDNNGSCFIYCDPPYVGTNSTYYEQWAMDDHNCLLKMLDASGARFCVSLWHSKGDEVNQAAVDMSNKYRMETIDHKYIVGPKAQNRMDVIEGLFFNY